MIGVIFWGAYRPQATVGLFFHLEVALQHFLIGFRPPRRDQIEVNGLISVIHAVINLEDHPIAPGVLIEPLVVTIAVIGHYDANRHTRVNGF